jgi:hypothetical protein
MRKLSIALVAAIALSTAQGCGGPYYVTGSVRDFYTQKYGESPWLWGNVIVNGLYMFAYGVCNFVDVVALNTYYFWLKDAQPFGDGKGTVYEHKKASSGKPFPK